MPVVQTRLRSPRRTASGYAKAALSARNASRVNTRPEMQEVVSGLNDAEVIGCIVRSLSADQLLERYHELVDQRLDGGIGFRESFELDRIEARLNAEDQDELGRLKVLQDDWQREREALVTSIENLLTVSGLRADQPCRSSFEKNPHRTWRLSTISSFSAPGLSLRLRILRTNRVCIGWGRVLRDRPLSARQEVSRATDALSQPLLCMRQV